MEESDVKSASRATQVATLLEGVALRVLLGSSAFPEATAHKSSPGTACVRLRNINAKLSISHLHHRRSPRENCLRSRVSGTNPS
jgi:hypothetical protein